MNRLKWNRCYLSGPMDRVADGGVIWRQDITKFLRSINIGVLDPTDKAIFGHDVKEDHDLMRQYKEVENWNDLIEMGAPIANLDLRMVDVADFLILYVNTSVHMCGSYFEACLATYQCKPIIVMSENGKKDLPNWLYWHLREHNSFFESWDDIKQHITYIDQSPTLPNMPKWRFFDYNKIYMGAV